MVNRNGDMIGGMQYYSSATCSDQYFPQIIRRSPDSVLQRPQSPISRDRTTEFGLAQRGEDEQKAKEIQEQKQQQSLLPLLNADRFERPGSFDVNELVNRPRQQTAVWWSKMERDVAVDPTLSCDNVDNVYCRSSENMASNIRLSGRQRLPVRGVNPLMPYGTVGYDSGTYYPDVTRWQSDAATNAHPCRKDSCSRLQAQRNDDVLDEEEEEEDKSFHEAIWDFIRTDGGLSTHDYAALSSLAPSPTVIPPNPFSNKSAGRLRAAVRENFLQALCSREAPEFCREKEQGIYQDPTTTYPIDGPHDVVPRHSPPSQPSVPRVRQVSQPSVPRVRQVSQPSKFPLFNASNDVLTTSLLAEKFFTTAAQMPSSSPPGLSPPIWSRVATPPTTASPPRHKKSLLPRIIPTGIAPLTRDHFQLMAMEDATVIEAFRARNSTALAVPHPPVARGAASEFHRTMARFMLPQERNYVSQMTLSQMARNPDLQRTGSSKWNPKFFSTISVPQRDMNKQAQKFNSRHSGGLKVEVEKAADGGVNNKTKDEDVSVNDVKKFGKVSYSSVRQPRALIRIGESSTKYDGKELCVEKDTVSMLPSLGGEIGSSIVLRGNIDEEINRHKQDDTLPITMSLLLEGVHEVTSKHFRQFIQAARSGNIEALLMFTPPKKYIARALELLYSLMLQVCDLDWDLPAYPPQQFSGLKHLGAYRMECLGRLLCWTIGMPYSYEESSTPFYMMSPVQALKHLEELDRFIVDLQEKEDDNGELPSIALSVYLVCMLASVEKGERFLRRLLLVLPWHLSILLASFLTVTRNFQHVRNLNQAITATFGCLVLDESGPCKLCSCFGVGDVITTQADDIGCGDIISATSSKSLDRNHSAHVNIFPAFVSRLLQAIQYM